MLYRKTKKALIILISIVFLTTCFSPAYSYSIKNKTEYDFISNNPRNALGENDEGAHHNDKYITQEWWYYNIIFNDPDSDLKDWSATVSFSVFPTVHGLKLALHDNKNNTYGSLYTYPRNNDETIGPNVNISFNNSYAKGRYPEWNVYAENTGKDETKITANLTFKANSKPIWIAANTGRNNAKSKIGYYCIFNCNVSGEITINETIYHVKGLGYHDHFWAPYAKKEKNTSNLGKTRENPTKLLDFNVWDWLVIHFDNGWDMFLGKVHSSKRTIFSNLMPGSICITPDGKNIMECFFFKIDYQETRPSSAPSINVPTKIHIKAVILKTTKPYGLFPPLFLDIYYEANTFLECLYGSPPDWGYWETTGQVHGKIKNFAKTIDLNGRATMEITNNIDTS